MRLMRIITLLLLSAAAIFFGTPTYRPFWAIVYANRHWNWAIASGKPAPVMKGGVLKTLSRTPGSGWFQPDYQCAEFVSRALHAGGVNIPIVSSSNPLWPIMVNVDRMTYFVLTRGWARPESPPEASAGDIVLFRYPLLGQAPSPTIWSHTAIIVSSHPMTVDAHNRSLYQAPLGQLSDSAVSVQAFHIQEHPHPHAPTPKSPHSQAEIAWRDLYTSQKAHLYWGQLFPIDHQTASQVWLKGVPGSLPPVAMAPMAPSPQLVWHKTSHVILGIDPQGRTLIATRHSPIPKWTGHPLITTAPLSSPYWHGITPQAVALRTSRWLSPVPQSAPIGKAWAPKNSVSVMDGVVSWHHRKWAQLEWYGALTGLAFVPLSSVKPITLRVVKLSAPLTLRSPNGSEVTVDPPAALAQRHGQYAYAGTWLSPQKTRTHLARLSHFG